MGKKHVNGQTRGKVPNRINHQRNANKNNRYHLTPVRLLPKLQKKTGNGWRKKNS